MLRILCTLLLLLSLSAGVSDAQTPPTLDSLVVNPVIPSHNYVTHGEYHNFKAYAHSNSGGSLTYQWYVNGTPKTTSWELHYSFPTWNSSPYTIHVDICDGSSCVSWEEIYTAGSPPGGGGGGTGPVLDSLVVNPIIPSHNYVTQGEYHNFKAYAHSTSGGSLTYQWYVNGTPKTTAWELHYSFPTWDASPYTIRLEVYDGADSTSWQETYTAGTPPGGGNVANKLYYIHDHLGSVRVVIDDNGDVVHYADYYPFGMEMAGRTSTTERPKEGFTGHEKDEETGNYYGEARYYDPEIGVWYNIDPMASKYPNASPYNYVFGNPILLADPTGADPYWDARFEGDEFHNWAAGSAAAVGDDYFLKADGTVTRRETGGRDRFSVQICKEAVSECYRLLDPTNESDLEIIEHFLSTNPAFRALITNSRTSPNEVYAAAGRANTQSRGGYYVMEAAGWMFTFTGVGSLFKVGQVGGRWVIGRLAKRKVAATLSQESTKLLGRGVNASWGKVFNYRHGGQMSAIEHIMYRHAHNSGFANVSRFSQGTSAKMIKGYVDQAVKYGKPIQGGFEYNIGRVIGIGQNGASASSIRVYVRDGWVRTAFPF